jgi:alpha-tubulin suppressor-like RCC1 family protein
VVQVATTNAEWFALRSSGEVDEWDTQTSMPTKVHFPDGVKIAKLADSGSFDTMLAIDTTGQVWGWGETPRGSCAWGTPTRTPTRSNCRSAA